MRAERPRNHPTTSDLESMCQLTELQATWFRQHRPSESYDRVFLDETREKLMSVGPKVKQSFSFNHDTDTLVSYRMKVIHLKPDRG